MSSEVLIFYKLLERLTSSLAEPHVKKKIIESLELLEDLPIAFKKQELSSFLLQVCEKAGLQSINDETSDNLTLCGSIFVFDVNPKSPQFEIKAKVSLASHTELKLLENYLSDLLRQGKWWRFTKAVEYLAFLDDQSSSGKIDLFKYQFGLEKDWEIIGEHESNQMNDLDSKITGHGKVTIFKGHYGVVLEYYPNYMANVILAKSDRFSLRILPEGVDQYLKSKSNGLEFHQGLEGSGLNIIYSMVLKPEVLISGTAIKELKALNEVHASSKMFEPVSYISKLASNDMSSDSDAFMIQEIPFQHPEQVYKVLLILRRQLTFNSLVLSCLKDAQKDGSRLLISIVENDYLKRLHLRFYHSKVPHVYFLKIEVDDSNSINYQVESLQGPVQSHGNSQLLTEQLSIPDFIDSIEIA